MAGMGMASTWGHDFAQALADASQAIAIAREVDATPVMAGGYLRPGWSTRSQVNSRQRRRASIERSPSAGAEVTWSISRSPSRLLDNS